jgi:hypothetical protein
MKTSIKILKSEIDKSESALKRANATKLDIALLAENLQAFKSDACKDLENNQQQIKLLEEKLATVGDVIHLLDNSIAECQNGVLAMKETSGVHNGEFVSGLKQFDLEHEDRYLALESRMISMCELIRSVDERNTEQYDAMQHRLQLLEERIPQLETNFKAFETSVDGHVDRIEKIQRAINTRIISVMRISLMSFGVFVVTALILGLFFYKH